jgi:hypothetical protein
MIHSSRNSESHIPYFSVFWALCSPSSCFFAFSSWNSEYTQSHRVFSAAPFHHWFTTEHFVSLLEFQCRLRPHWIDVYSLRIIFIATQSRQSNASMLVPDNGSSCMTRRGAKLESFRSKQQSCRSYKQGLGTYCPGSQRTSKTENDSQWVFSESVGTSLLELVSISWP